MKELFELIEKRRSARRFPHAVATVLRVEGSSYRRPGARMLIDAHGRAAGSISGGCLERSVVAEGRRAILDGSSRLLTFDTTDQDDLAFGTSLGCQGKIWIGLEMLPANVAWPLETFAEEIRSRRQCAVLLTEWAATPAVQFEATPYFERDGSDEVADVFRTRRTRYDVSREALLEWMAPPLSLLLFGGGPDIGPMLRLANELGHEVTVIDRRLDVARGENFPAARHVLHAKPHEVGALVQADGRTAAVLMNHHYDTDRDVLASLIPLRLPYLAMLGPKHRTKRILEELEAEGHDLGAIGDLHAPAGLDIGAETPEQIALAVLAEIQAALSGRQGGHLRDRKAPIHADAFTDLVRTCALPG